MAEAGEDHDRHHDRGHTRPEQAKRRGARAGETGGAPREATPARGVRVRGGYQCLAPAGAGSQGRCTSLDRTSSTSSDSVRGRGGSSVMRFLYSVRLRPPWSLPAGRRAPARSRRGILDRSGLRGLAH